MIPKFGWLPHKQRSAETKLRCAQIIKEMPDWFPVSDEYGTNKACIWEVAKQGGINKPLLFQEEGSCVSQGMTNALHDVQTLEIVRKHEPEVYKQIFLPWHYGLGRLESGIRGPGHGSTGSGQIKAVEIHGVVFQLEDPSLPKPRDRGDGSITWGSRVETEWSDGRANLRKTNLVTIGKTHLVRRSALMKSAKDVMAWIGQGLGPVTIASDWGGLMDPPVKEGVLLNRRATTWNHQMEVPGWWLHPSLGLLFFIQNSWGDAHGSCPSGAPKGGFWVVEKEIDYICRQEDSFGITDLDGFDDDSNIWFPVAA